MKGAGELRLAGEPADCLGNRSRAGKGKCGSAVSMIVNGFCRDVFQKLPMEFAVEARKLLGITLEGAVG